MKHIHSDHFLPNLTFADDWWVLNALIKTKQTDAKNGFGAIFEPRAKNAGACYTFQKLLPDAPLS